MRFTTFLRMVPLESVAVLLISALLASIFWPQGYAIFGISTLCVVALSVFRLAIAVEDLVKRNFWRSSDGFARAFIAISLVYPCYQFNDELHLFLFWPSYITALQRDPFPEFDWGVGKTLCGPVQRKLDYYPDTAARPTDPSIRHLIGNYYVEYRPVGRSRCPES